MIPVFPIVDEANSVRKQTLEDWLDILSDGSFVGGRWVQAFEYLFGQTVGAPAVSCASGTDALVLALKALGVGPGATVTVPALTFTATAEAVLRVGATLKFADVKPTNGMIKSVKSDVIIAVALWGNRPNVRFLREHCPRAKIIVDAAQYFHPDRDPSPEADLVTYSFYPTKPLGGAGDGGAVTVPSGNTFMVEKLRALANHGRATWDKNTHVVTGLNSRLDALQAAFLANKLAYNLPLYAARDRIYSAYAERLGPQLLSERDAAHGVVVVNFVDTKDRETVERRLTANSVGFTRQYPTPLHLQPAYSFLGYQPGDFPNAEALAERSLVLPCHPYMTVEDAEMISDIVLSVRP